MIANLKEMGALHWSIKKTKPNNNNNKNTKTDAKQINKSNQASTGLGSGSGLPGVDWLPVVMATRAEWSRLWRAKTAALESHAQGSVVPNSGSPLRLRQEKWKKDC